MNEGSFGIKAVLIAVIAVVVFIGSVVFMPWAELGFGLDKKEVPGWATGIVASPLYQSLQSTGQDSYDKLNKAITKTDAQQNGTATMTALIAGNYTYAFAMAILLILASVGIMLIGREDSEEKTILPVKK
jgi:NADH:ubiquinone oxidoreductase subunit 6 (subunit J)